MRLILGQHCYAEPRVPDLCDSVTGNHQNVRIRHTQVRAITLPPLIVRHRMPSAAAACAPARISTGSGVPMCRRTLHHEMVVTRF
jgi:hypothetical protein